jgi:hypothetical protein
MAARPALKRVRNGGETGIEARQEWRLPALRHDDGERQFHEHALWQRGIISNVGFTLRAAVSAFSNCATCSIGTK